jgi:hypothetical protein
MAATYYVVINQEAYPSDSRVGKITGKGEILPPGLQSAKFVKIESEAGTVAQAQAIAREQYPGLTTNTPIVVAEAAWKES